MSSHPPHPPLTATGRPAPVPVSVLEALTLAAVLVLALYVRVNDLQAWGEQVDMTFSEGSPLLANLDGYYFLSLARDLLEGDYQPVDPLRAAPMGAPRPIPPPLLALLTAGVARLGGLSLDWVATLLPVVLGPLLALPVHGIGRRVAGPAAGIAAALVAVLSHYYVYRTSAGFFDTDCLNVTLATGLAWWGLRLGDAPAAQFRRWLAGGAALLATWLWWWHGGQAAVVALAAWALACALAQRPARRRERVEAGLTCAAIAAVAMAVGGTGLPARFASDLIATVRHVSKAPGGDFPNVASSIGEQAPATLGDAAHMTLGDPVLAAFALAGLLWLALSRRRAGAQLLGLATLAVLGILFAQRFLIFAAPLTGLGAGWLAGRGLVLAGTRPWLNVAVAVGVAAMAVPSLVRGIRIDFLPAAGSDIVAAMRWAGRETPPDAVLWALWDYGYHLRYWSRRATVNDGSVHTGELTVYDALPYAAPTFRLAANFMQFYSVHGQPGMRRVYAAAGGAGPGLGLLRQVLDAGPAKARAVLESQGLPAPGGGGTDAWLAFLFPARAPPLYLFVDQRMLLSARWWYRYGTWHPGHDAGTPPRLEAFFDLHPDRDGIIGPRLRVNLRNGTARVDGGAPVPLSRLVMATPRGIRSSRFSHSGPEFHFFAPDGFGVLEDPAMAQTVFSNAFVLKATARRYFTPAHLGSGSAQIWRVHGDVPR